jgi:type IV pilus assembly protein PilX
MQRVSTCGPTIARRGTHAVQRGAALVVALILLVVITLVGLAAIGTTLLQNKAASNQYDRQVAFQSAEAALRQAQVAIQAATATLPAPAGFEDCSTPSGGSTPANVCQADPFKDAGVPAAQIVSVATAQFNAGALAAAQPQYVVQYLGPFLAPTPAARQIGGPQQYGASPPGTLADYYLITARSGDPTQVTGRSIVTLQSIFRN